MDVFGEIGRLHELKARLVEERIGLVYSNTIANGSLLRAISHLNCPVITHVHELEQLIQYFGSRNCRLVLRHSQRFIAVSQAVKDNLVSRHGAPLESIDVVHSSIPLSVNSSKDKQQTRSRILEKLGIPHESLIVGACGSTSYQKGADLFVRLARVVCERHQGPPIHFVWVGPDTRELRFSALRRQVDRFGLSGRVHFIGKQPGPLDYFAAFDVFALTSREDSLPLVILEAASVGKPIVCFGCAGGAKEFVEEDCGFVIPTLDVELMAERTILLLSSYELRERFGRRASQKFQEKHTIERAAPTSVGVIQRFFPVPLSPEWGHTPLLDMTN